MVRPRKTKFVNFDPEVKYFKPRGVPLSTLREVEINIEELEALRLSELENLSQVEAAEKMDVHQSTFQRTLARARYKVTEALINGCAIKLNGGAYKMPNKDGTGPQGKGPRTGRGKGNCNKKESSQGRGPCGKGLRLGKGRRFSEE